MANSAEKSCGLIVWQSESGVTLLEVVSSLGILIILLAVLSQLLYTGGRMWLKTDQAYQKQHQLQDVYALVAAEVRFAYNSQFLPEKALVGNEQELIFWRETSKGLERVVYQYDALRKTLDRTAGFWGAKPEKQTCLDNQPVWKFEYYEASSRNWKSEWRAANQSALPALVRVNTAMGTVVIPIEAWHEEEDD